jgi:hypothetical protein
MAHHKRWSPEVQPRLDKGRFAAVYEHANDSVLQMTPSELQLFIEGRCSGTRTGLSPSGDWCGK